MRLVLLVRRDSGRDMRAYLRAVDRPYTRVPMAGELVMLDDGGEHGQAVDQVSWDNDGVPVLRFVDPAVSEAWLAAAGFDLYVDAATSVYPR
jgi:hypothetical protein